MARKHLGIQSPQQELQHPGRPETALGSPHRPPALAPPQRRPVGGSRLALFPHPFSVLALTLCSSARSPAVTLPSPVRRRPRSASVVGLLPSVSLSSFKSLLKHQRFLKSAGTDSHPEKNILPWQEKKPTIAKQTSVERKQLATGRKRVI